MLQNFHDQQHTMHKINNVAFVSKETACYSKGRMRWARWHDSESECSSIDPAVITKQQPVRRSSDDVIQIKQKLEIVITEKMTT